MNRSLWITVICCLTRATALQAQTTWTVATQADKLTDKKVLTGTAHVHVSGPSSPLYELTLKCDGTILSAAVATFDAAQQPRPIPQWERKMVDMTPRVAAMLGVRVIDGVMAWKDIRYRIDDERVKNTTLNGTQYSNVGQAELLHAPLPPEVATAMADLDKLAAALGVTPDFIGLPKDRLLIADVFPDETVEFSFRALTVKQRNDVQHWCFDAAEKAAADQKVAEDKAAADKKAAEEAGRQRELQAAQAKAARVKAAVEQQCRAVSPLPVEYADRQVRIGDKWKALGSVWPQVQCAPEEAVRRLLGTPAVSTTPEGLTVWEYEVRVGSLLRGYQGGTATFYVVNGIVAYPF